MQSHTESSLPFAGGRSARVLVSDLLRPEAYPTRSSGVELRHTHASWVFLTPTEAWKVKRPVDYGFLDYSTPEKRQECCEAEVELGRRLAPDVYRGVSPIHLGPNGHSFVGPGPIVDHAVRMRRLPEEDGAGLLLGLGRLTAQHLRSLADRLAAFYEEAAETPELGGPAILRTLVNQNYQQTLPFVGRFVDAALVERLFAWQEDQVLVHEQRLLQRVLSGRIRDGHGDLRLEHVFFPGGSPEAPIVIDPIEFNARFRCADMALDAAFLTMELEANHRSDLAAAYLSDFARAANDYELYPLLDLYLSYRAWVRAKVACLVAADPSTAPAKASRKGREAAALFQLAASYVNPVRRAPFVIAVGGMVASGKSTVADALTLALGFPCVSSDATRKYLGRIPARARGGARMYAEDFTRRTYAELFRRGGEVLASGRGVILDATFGDPDRRRDLAGLGNSSCWSTALLAVCRAAKPTDLRR